MTLGHPPFGHTGEDALGELMAPYGGFDHNAQALRIVTRLERHYAGFDGLNLTWETLEGIAKHNGPVAEPWSYALAEVNAALDLELDTHASAEAQVAAIADDVAYNHHDLHDGLRAGLFTEADLMELPVTGPAFAEVDRLYPGLDPTRRRHEALRRIFGVMVDDVIAVARNRLAGSQPKTRAGYPRDGRADHPVFQAALPEPQGDQGVPVPPACTARPRWWPSVQRVTRGDPATCSRCTWLEPGPCCPPNGAPTWRGRRTRPALARVVLDYVAGMTDRFAIAEHQRLVPLGARPPERRRNPWLLRVGRKSGSAIRATCSAIGSVDSG